MNITLERAVIEQALEALEAMNPYPASKEDQRNKAITALRAALEQPTRSQKMADAGFMPRDTRLTCDECGGQFTRQILPIHKCTALGQPEQEPLSDDEIQAIWKKTFESGLSPRDFARAIEEAIWKKNF